MGKNNVHEKHMAQIKEQLFQAATYSIFFCLKLGWLYQSGLLKGQKLFLS